MSALKLDELFEELGKKVKDLASCNKAKQVKDERSSWT